MEERGYVEGSGVEAVLVDALIVVCAKRPSTPVSFLGDYLLSVSQATPRDVPTAGANDSSVKTESFKAEVTKVETKSTAIPVSESESEVSKPKSATAPVNDQDSKNVKTTSTLGREASPVSPRKKTDAPPITVPDAMKVQKMEVVPPKAVATDISSKPSEPKRPETEKAPQPEQVSPVVAVVPVSAKMQPPAMPSPTKLAPVPEAAKPVHQPPPQAISTGPPLVAPMQPLGTAPMMSVTSQSSVPGGILKQSKPATIVYKDDLFEDDER